MLSKSFCDVLSKSFCDETVSWEVILWMLIEIWNYGRTVLVFEKMNFLRCFMWTGLWAGTARKFWRAWRAGLARKKTHRAMPGPKIRPACLLGTARRAWRAYSARTPSGRAGPLSCQPGRAVAHLYPLDSHQCLTPNTCKMLVSI